MTGIHALQSELGELLLQLYGYLPRTAFRVVLHIIDFRVTYFKTIPSASWLTGMFIVFWASGPSRGLLRQWARFLCSEHLG